MFLKKGYNKSKQRSSSCLFYCFNVSVVADSGNLETSAGATGDAKKLSASCFSWCWFRKKKKSLKLTNNHGTKRYLQGKIFRSRSVPLAPLEPTKNAAVVDQVNTQPHPSLKQQLMLQYDTQTRPESSNLPTEPESSRRMLSQPQPDHQATSPPQINTQARAKWARKLDSSAGLTVIGVTLAVMMFYGRATAVVSLCACLYIAAILRPSVVTEVVVEKMAGASYADVDSEEYKKRVVMEGLLERRKRRLQTHLGKN